MMFRSRTYPCFRALVARQPDRPRQDTSTILRIKTLLVEDSYLAVHTTVQQPLAEDTQDDSPWLIPRRAIEKGGQTALMPLNTLPPPSYTHPAPFAFNNPPSTVARTPSASEHETAMGHA